MLQKYFEQPQDLEQLCAAKVNAKDLYEMRLIFEPEAAYLAAIRGTDAEIKRIYEEYFKSIIDIVHTAFRIAILKYVN